MDSLEWSIWSECKFKCLEKWFRSAMTIIYLANIAIGITSDDHSFLKARQLFNMVLVQLMLGGPLWAGLPDNCLEYFTCLPPSLF